MQETEFGRRGRLTGVVDAGYLVRRNANNNVVALETSALQGLPTDRRLYLFPPLYSRAPPPTNPPVGHWRHPKLRCIPSALSTAAHHGQFADVSPRSVIVLIRSALFENYDEDLKQLLSSLRSKLDEIKGLQGGSYRRRRRTPWFDDLLVGR